MLRPLAWSADRWVKRRARPEAAALAAVAGFQPAVVITGGSRGIGLALARRFSEAASHRVVLVARGADDLAAAALELAGTFGLPPHVIAVDIRDPAAFDTIQASLKAERLYLDILVNNAGVGLAGAFEAADRDALSAMIDLNVVSLARLSRHVLPELLDRGRGGLLNISSLGGLVPGPNQAAYYASKAFVVSLTEAIAHETRGRGVRVAVVVPGPVDTGFHAAMGASGALYRRLFPARSPQSVAEAAFRGYVLGRTVIAPGVLETAAQYAVRIVPHWVSSRILEFLLRVPAGDPAGASDLTKNRSS